MKTYLKDFTQKDLFFLPNKCSLIACDSLRQILINIEGRSDEKNLQNTGYSLNSSTNPYNRGKLRK